MLATEWSLGNVIWAMLVFFVWCMAIWIFIMVFADIFRRQDIGGGAKAAWILLIVIVPLFGALIYLIVRPRGSGAADPRGADSYASTNPVPGGREAPRMG
jgi:hypothetical protein